MIRKLRIKFILIIMVIVTIMLSVIFGILYSAVQQDLESQAVSMLRAMASEPRQAQRPQKPGGKVLLPYMVLQLNHAGEIQSASGVLFDLTDASFLSDILKATKEDGGEVGYLKSFDLRYCRRFSPEGETITFCDTSNERSMLRGMLKSSALVGAASFFVFLVISILFSKWAIQPVEKAWLEQRQFVADASHELKTPLTVIMTNAELLQSPDFDSETREQFLDSILAMCNQMRSLVEKMLELARADYHSQPITMSKVDLSRLAEDAYLSFEGIFYERGLRLCADITPNLFVRGNQDCLRQVLDILLDNAQKYSTPGGETVLSLQVVHGKCRLSVANPGPEISHSDLKKIFQRFYRADTARSRDGSFGLGLPIAQQILSQHHGRIWAESDHGMITMLVELALSATQECQKIQIFK